MSKVDTRTAEKRKKLEAALERGVVMIHLDARFPGVLVPQKFREDFHLRLNLSWRFDPPDLSVGDWGVRETLSFNRSAFKVAVPWQAIFAITAQGEDEAYLFPEDMPNELVAAAARQATPEAQPEKPVLKEVERPADVSPAIAALEAAAEPRRFVPRVVEAAPAAVTPPPEPPPDDGGGARRGHLRIVK
ncbi:MAG: ClpXP protease specificity-enhancing factor SspB [Myxococcales bacterium]